MPNDYLTLLQGGGASAPEAGDNPYLSMLEQGDRQRGAALRGSLMGAVDADPEAEARARRVASYLGTVPPAVQALPREAERTVKVRRIEADTAQAPVLAQRFSDADWAKLAHDDSGVLSALERGVVGMAKFITSAPGAAYGGLVGAGSALLSGLPSAGGGMYGAAAFPFELLGSTGPGSFGGFLREQQKNAEGVAKGMMPDLQGASPEVRGFFSGMQSAGMNLTMLPLGLAAGTNTMLGAMGTISGGRSYGKGRDAGLSPLRAGVFGFQDGLADVVTEKFMGAAGLLSLVKAGASAGKLAAFEILKEVPGEMAATLWQNFNEWANVNPDKTLRDFVLEQPDALRETIVATLVGGGVQIGAIKAVEGAVGRATGQQQQAQAAEARGQALAELATMAEASKLRQRDPEAFQQFADELTAQQVPHLYVDAAVLNQSGVDIQAVAQALPSVAAQIQRAIATGGDLVIPTGEFLAAGGQAFTPALIENARTAPDAMSQAEARQYMAERGDQLQAEVARVLGEQQGDAAFKASRDEVQQAFLQQLNQAGRFTQDVNGAYASMLSNFYAVQAARAGITPAEMLARYPLQVASKVGDSRAAVLEQGGRPEAASAIDTGKRSPLTGKPLIDVLDAAGNRIETQHIAATPDEALANYRERPARQAASRAAAPAPSYYLPEKSAVAKGSNWRRVQGQEFTALDENDGFLYHVTSAPAAKGVREQGLVPGAGGMFGGFYANYSAGKVFVTERAGVSYWIDKVEGQLAHQMDNPPAVVVMRIPRDKIEGKLQPDEVGTSDAGAPAMFSTQVLNQQARGQIALGTDAQQGAIITLLKDADLSTFLHESGHWFLEVQADMAARIAGQISDGASVSEGEREALADMNRLLAWFGIQDTPEASALTQWLTMPLEEKRAYHEQFARGFEAYAFEGKSPSIELQGLFQRFRAWLLNVYKDLKALNVTLTDEVRGVFDRMVATTEQIQTAEAARQMGPLFESAEQAGMTPDEWTQYHGMALDATQQAIENLQTRGLRDMRWLDNARSRKLKEMQRLADGLRREVRAEVRAEVMAQPVYQAWQFLTGKGDAIDTAQPDKAKAAKLLDPTRDSLLVAIAKLGGISRASAARDLSVSKDYRGVQSGVFGSPVFRKEGGSTADDMAGQLAEAGYLPLDEQGKHSLHDLEQAVADELGGQPQYSTWHDYAQGQGDTPVQPLAPEVLFGKLDTAELRRMYGTAEGAAWRKLSGLRMTSEANGVHPDVVAETFGFDSGDALVQALLAADPPTAVIQGMTDQRMLERFGDLGTAEGLARAADKAIHSDARARFMAAELQALERANAVRENRPGQRSTVNVLARAARDYAANVVAQAKVRDLRPSQYTAAEARAGKAAIKAMKAGDLQEAAAQKRNQMIQAAAARATLEAQDEVRRAVDYFRRFDKRIKSIDPSYQDQIDALLERFDLRASTSLKAIDKRKSLLAWVEAQKEQGMEPDIDPALLVDAGQRSYKDMTVEELRGLRDAIRQIEHLGRLKNRLLTSQEQREWDKVREAMVDSIEANAGDRKADTRTPATVLGRKLLAVRNFGAAHIKVATWARIMDGGQDGPVWEYLVRTANERGDMETTMRAEATRQLHAIVEPLLKAGKMGGKGQFFASINRSMNREQIIAMALNTGNAGNWQRMLGGEGWTVQQVQPVLATLSAADWRAVQAVWDHFEQYRPAIGAKERRVYGKEPNWIEAQPFDVTTADGETVSLRGGYYPIKYDPLASRRAEQHNDAEAAKRELQGAYTSATTRRGFTKARAEEVQGRPLLYSLAGVYSGVNDVIHDLAWHEWLIDAGKILRSDSIDQAIRSKYGPEVVRQFKTWMQDIARGEAGLQAELDSALGRLRHGVSIAGLGFNVMSAAMQPLGLTQSMARVGATWVAKGVAQYITSPIDSTRRVNEASDFMANRSRTRFRELNELRNQVEGQTAVRKFVSDYAFLLMMRCQQMVDVPTWLGAYEKAMADGNTEQRAAALADQAVIDAQGGGQIKDLSGIERGGPAQKLFTVFYSFMNTALNVGYGQAKTAPKTAAGRAKLAADLLLLYTVPAVLGALLKDALTPGDAGDDDPEKLLKKLLGAQLDYLMGLFVLVRETTEAAKIVTGLADRPRDYAGPAGLRLIPDTVGLAKQTMQGELDDAFRKAAINVTGDLFGLPAAQLNRTITGAQALADGKTQNPAALAFGFQEPR